MAPVPPPFKTFRMEKTRVESEYLILTLKKYECIWNKNSPDYHNKILKENSWNEICEELIEGWKNMKPDVKHAKQYELKKRWNNIRDYYKKDLQLQLSGAIGQTKRKKYVFSNSLDFLRPLLDQSQSYEKQSEEEPDEQEVYLEEHLYSSEDETSALKRKAVKIEENHVIEDKQPYTIPTRNSEYVEDDCDWLFLRSLLTDMKEMNRSQKLEFRMGILKLYKDIMFESADEDIKPSNPKRSNFIVN